MLNWLKGLFGGKKPAAESSPMAAPVETPTAPTAPAQDMTGGNEEAAIESSQEAK